MNLQRNFVIFMLILLFSLSACSKYEPAGSDFKVEIKGSNQTTYGAGGKHQSSYTINALTINGHPIELPNETKTTEKSFLLNTKDFGPMKVEVKDSADGSAFGMTLLMTAEQKAKIKALGIKQEK